MGKYWVLGFFFVVVFVTITFADDEVYYRVKDGKIGYYWDMKTVIITQENYSGIVSNGTILKGRTFSQDEMTLYNNLQEIVMHSSSLESANKQDEFSNDLIVDTKTASKMWLFDYYLEALSKTDKNIIYEREKEWFDFYNEHEFRNYDWEDFWTRNRPTYFNPNFAFYQNGLVIQGYGILIDTIEKTKNGYRVKALGDFRFDRLYGIRVQKVIAWPLSAATNFFTLIFEFDGDYLTVYLENKETVFARFVHVDVNLYNMIHDLVHENLKSDYHSYDFTWPRRADGSMDYQPPKPTQTAVTEQPEVVDIADYGEATEPDPVEETVGRQSGAGFPWVVMAIIAGIALVGVTAFVVILRKKR
jgi:hypothetical protein